MNIHRRAARWVAALLVGGAFAVGSVAPAQASTHHTTHHVAPADTGWNGT